MLIGFGIGACALVGGGGLIYATMIEPRSLRVRRYDLPIENLPPEFDGFRLVQISDTHLGRWVGEDFLRRVVEVAVSLSPDAYLLTGDYIHDGTRNLALAVDIFRPLVHGAGARPTFGVLGNHDWYGDGPALARMLQHAGVHMIDNDRVFLDGRGDVFREPFAGGICIAGLGDLIEDTIVLESALDGVPLNMPRLVLAHNPDTAELPQIAQGGRRIDAMFGGHTHGGQVCLPFIGPPVTLSRYGKKYIGGVVNAPACRVVVSRGIGTSVLPTRFCVPPELVEVTLRHSAAGQRVVPDQRT